MVAGGDGYGRREKQWVGWLGVRRERREKRKRK